MGGEIMEKEMTLEELQKEYREMLEADRKKERENELYKSIEFYIKYFRQIQEQEEEKKRKALAESQEYYQRILEKMDGADYSQCLKAANNFHDDIGKIEKDYNKGSKR